MSSCQSYLCITHTRHIAETAYPAAWKTHDGTFRGWFSDFGALSLKAVLPRGDLATLSRIHHNVGVWSNMTRTLCISAFAICALAAAAQTRQQKVVEELHAKQQTLQGILIDAGCEDRTLWNMERPAETQS